MVGKIDFPAEAKALPCEGASALVAAPSLCQAVANANQHESSQHSSSSAAHVAQLST